MSRFAHLTDNLIATKTTSCHLTVRRLINVERFTLFHLWFSFRLLLSHSVKGNRIEFDATTSLYIASSHRWRFFSSTVWFSFCVDFLWFVPHDNVRRREQKKINRMQWNMSDSPEKWLSVYGQRIETRFISIGNPKLNLSWLTINCWKRKRSQNK